MQYEVANWGPFLATRERGRQVREDVESKLSNLRTGETLVLSFASVEGITVSFGDECIAKLIVDRSVGLNTDRGFVISNANEDVSETLEAVLSRRKLSAVSLTKFGKAMIVGERGWLPETLEAAIELQSFSAMELAEMLQLTPQAANNRLKVLVTTGAVARDQIVPEGGGKEFCYTVVIPAFT
ncbi:MAG: DUF4325 domain-containing protein [Acidimicrobiales bacterium]